MTRRQILDDPEIGNKAEAFEAFDDIPTNPNLQRTIGDVINARYGRRDILRGMLGVTATTALFGTSAMVAPRQASAATADSRYVLTNWPGAMTKPIRWPMAMTPMCCCGGAIRSPPTRPNST